MKKILLLLCLSFLISCDKDEPIIDDPIDDKSYFPPKTGDSWDSIDTDSLGWNQSAIEDLKEYMVETNSKAMIIIKEGKIAFEHYVGTDILGQAFTKNSTWYWASAGKTLTSFLVGLAQEDGFLDITNPSSDYLGSSWTSLPEAQELEITVKNQLSMTTGLDDGAGDSDCTDPECLLFLTEPGTRWAYHNAPYTNLDGVIEGASGESFNTYFNRKLRDPIGMDEFWTYLDYNHVYFSTARAMARFGLLNLHKGKWEEEEIMGDINYFEDMTSTSQELNKSYGYLWWLNGKPSYMLPGLQIVLPGDVVKSAPSDMVSGIGKNGQIVSFIPSEDMVVVRMGDNPDQSLVPVVFVNELWDMINLVLDQ